MSNADNHINSWSDADIRKYLQGELSAREMHELEKAALDDPFLSDALEGLATQPRPEGDLDELHTRLTARVEENKHRTGLLWFNRPALRVAAAIILLAGLCFTAYYLLLDRKEYRPAAAEVAKAATQKPPTVPPPPQNTTPQQPATQQQAAPQQQQAALADSAEAQGLVAIESHRQVNHHSKPAPITATLRSTLAADTAKQAAAKQAATNQASYADANLSAASADKAVRSDSSIAPLTSTYRSSATPATPSPVANAQNDAFAPMAFNKAYTASPLRFSGFVVDANNRPLQGASLNLNGASNLAITTDARGKFDFKVSARDTAQQMTVSLEGYQPASFTLNTNAQTNNIIRLQEAKNALDEVVVTGFGAKRKETLAAAPSDSDDRLDSAWLKVFPVIGRLAYEQYLATAKKALFVDSAIMGTERISFQVDQKGRITDFKIEQSLSPAHDAGLIQLISDGPAWRLLRGKKARAIVSLSFP